MATCRKLFDEKALEDSHTDYASDTQSSDFIHHVLSSIRKPSPPTQTLNPNSSANSKRNMDSKPSTQKKKETETEVAGDALGDADSDYIPMEENTPSALIKRDFSISDEISILQHLIAYGKENGSNPTSSMASFYDYIQQEKALHLDITQTQLSRKIRSLKEKVIKYAGSVPPDPSQTHQFLLFDLSTKVWGQCKQNNTPSKRNMDSKPFIKKKKKRETEELEADSDTHVSEVNVLSEIKLTDEVMSVLKKVIKIDEQYVDFETMYPYMASALERGGKEEMMKKWRSIGDEVLEKMEDELKACVKLELKARRRSLQVLNKLHAKWLGD